ncbi:bifunctional phosphoribosyl-AMP cyclohydrolase/phosphoribosyl-ATP diphosphatase HisIE [Gorillibacterium massiliense]|uniref:bifunctional phosphoribosyl-AMP cyclohydrolase/phosphoribosyl-ATP diphosphatase HisIE n=1 Tax=Gorillibacterium massiliense TaxID=1280390 RepID=UPI0006938CEF
MSEEQTAFIPLEQAAERIRWDEKGLAPAIVQDAVSKDVLMLAYMNLESLRLTVESGETWFWSRSRGELWHKGATSGNIQKVRALSYDCDADTLLVTVIPYGPACHNGTYTCFTESVALSEAESSTPADQLEPTTSATAAADFPSTSGSSRFHILSELESIIARRDAERPEGSYTTYLFEKGLDKILKKIGEETSEVIIAAKNGDNEELRGEASDLLFHLMVLLRSSKLPLDDILQELHLRHNK